MIGGLDPGNDAFGIALLDTERGVAHRRPPRLHHIGSVSMRGAKNALEDAARVVGVFGLCPPGGGVVRIEVPPPSVQADVRHGAQAALGWALGWVSAAVATRLYLTGHEIELVDVSPWRAAMLETSTRWGYAAYAPGKGLWMPDPDEGRQKGKAKRTDTGIVFVWDGCGHETAISVEQRQGFTYQRCPRCEVAAKRKPRSAAEERRQAWKRLACTLVRVHWPDPYEGLIRDARSRSRTEKADHELAGVADACEAVWIAVSALEAA